MNKYLLVVVFAVSASAHAMNQPISAELISRRDPASLALKRLANNMDSDFSNANTSVDRERVYANMKADIGVVETKGTDAQKAVLPGLRAKLEFKRTGVMPPVMAPAPAAPVVIPARITPSGQQQSQFSLPPLWANIQQQQQQQRDQEAVRQRAFQEQQDRYNREMQEREAYLARLRQQLSRGSQQQQELLRQVDALPAQARGVAVDYGRQAEQDLQRGMEALSLQQQQQQQQNQPVSAEVLRQQQERERQALIREQQQQQQNQEQRRQNFQQLQQNRTASAEVQQAVQKLNKVDNNYECPVCLEGYPVESGMWTIAGSQCKHALCKFCKDNISRGVMRPLCPICRARMDRE